MLKWGVALTTYHPKDWTQHEVFERSLEYAQAAEEYDYDDVWLLEHHFTKFGLCSNTLIMAAFILGNTKRIRAGTSVIVAPLMNPIRLAEDVALVDQLSHGRFTAGFGRGILAKDFEVCGVDPSQTHRIMQEWIEIAVAGWTQETVKWESDLITIPEIPVYPEPFTKPHPPILVAGQSPSTIEWAAAHGIPLIMVNGTQINQMRSNIELYNEFAEASGLDPTGVPHVLFIPAHIAESREAAQREILDNVSAWYDEGGRASFTPEQLRALPNYRFHYAQIQDAVLGGARGAPEVVKQVLDVSPVGSADDCIEIFSGLRDATGIEHFVCGLEGAIQPERVIETIARFSEEVVRRM